MNEKKNSIEIQKAKIISLAKEYVENTKCFCGAACCWKCLFEHNLNVLEYEQAKESAVEDSQAKGCEFDDYGYQKNKLDNNKGKVI